MHKKTFGVVILIAGIIGFASFAQSARAVRTQGVFKAPLSVAQALPTAPAEPTSVPPEKQSPEEKIEGDIKDKDKEKKEKDDPKADDLYAQVELFSYALTTIQSEYVDRKKAKELIYGALTGMLGSLDPHSQFMEPDEYNELKTETEGKFGGLGIEITIRDGLLTVVTPIEDSPAWKAGLKAGDRIVRIEKTLTRDINLNDAVKKLRGEPGSKVKITVLRESEGKIQDYEITREIIHVQDVKDPHIVDDQIAYLRLAEFREDSYEQVYKHLKELKDKGASALILDLRNNPGGLLNVAIKISELFLPEGKTIVSTKGRHPTQDSVSVSHNGKNDFAAWPIVVLINEGSASGSEILAGALKDNKRAVTLGAKSFGKGSVQSVIPLPDGSGLRLTTAKYLTPSGVSIHEIGITPDIVVEREVPGSESEDADGVERNGKSKDSAKKVFDDIEKKDITDPNELEKKKREETLKTRMKEDNQIQAAISVIKGIRVYKQLESGTNANAKK